MTVMMMMFRVMPAVVSVGIIITVLISVIIRRLLVVITAALVFPTG